MLSALAMILVDQQSDPIKELVLRFLLSYGGIAGGVSFLVEALKVLFKEKITGIEPVLVIVLAFVLGSAAKGLMPDIYGPNTTKAWGLHELILVFVAVGAAAFHDKFLSVLTAFIPKRPPSTGGGGGAGLGTNGPAGGDGSPSDKGSKS